MQIDVARAIGATTREVQSREYEGKEARVVIASRTYDTTIEDLWDALTDPERIPRWFLPVSGDLRLGGKYQFKGNAGGTITACEPPHRLGATWEMGPNVSWLSVTLAADPAGGTRLQLEHMAHPTEHWAQYGPGAVGIGWELGLMGLAAHLHTRAAVDPADAQAWSMSEDGKAFIRGSGEGWIEAAIAGGENEAEARASGARTIAFYTGG